MTASLLPRAYALEFLTLGWNVIGVPVLLLSAANSGSVGLLGFGLDSLLEIGASGVVLWELSASDASRQARALRILGAAFAVLAVYLLAHSSWTLASGQRAERSAAGTAWTAASALVMTALALGKHRVGVRLGNPVVIAEARVTAVDAALAAAVLAGLLGAWVAGAWWADPAAGLLVAAYAAREARELLG